MPEKNKNELLIDIEYLKALHRLSVSERYAKLEKDITDRFGGEIGLKAPVGTILMPLFNDVRAYVSARREKGNYDVRVYDTYDRRMVKQLTPKPSSGHYTSNIKYAH